MLDNDQVRAPAAVAAATGASGSLPAMTSAQGALSLQPARAPLGGRGAQARQRTRSMGEAWRARTPFALIVGAPTLLATAYFGVFAADRYVAEASFVIRSAERPIASGLGALLQSSGLNGAQSDSHLVHAFIQSRDALRQLEEGHGFSAQMGHENADVIARWPNWFDGDSLEGLHDYYLRRVTVASDVTTGISELRVEAFSPQDAQGVAEALLGLSEDFVNSLNQRAEVDTLDLARREVERAEQRLADNQRAFNALREERGFVDPAADTKLQFELVSALSIELANVEADLSRLRRDAPNRPEIAALRSRAVALREQIAVERSALVGRDGALIESYGAFESMTLDREFATGALLAAQAALERARIEASRKKLYLARIASPVAPDKAREPRRIMMILTAASASLLIYAAFWLLYVNAREHRS